MRCKRSVFICLSARWLQLAQKRGFREFTFKVQFGRVFWPALEEQKGILRSMTINFNQNQKNLCGSKYLQIKRLSQYFQDCASYLSRFQEPNIAAPMFTIRVHSIFYIRDIVIFCLGTVPYFFQSFALECPLFVPYFCRNCDSLSLKSNHV